MCLYLGKIPHLLILGLLNDNKVDKSGKALLLVFYVI